MRPHSSSSSPKLRGVGAHRGLDRQDVLAQGRATPSTRRRGTRPRSRERARRHGCYPSPAPGRPTPSGPAPRSWRSSSSKAACRCPAPSCPPATRTRPCRCSPACLLTEERGRAPQRAADPRHARRCSTCSTTSASRSSWRDEQHRRAAGRRASRKTEVDPTLAERIRASFLVAGPLLARFGAALLPPPGGDVIGRRRLDPHLDAFRALGAHGRARAATSACTRPTAACSACDFFMDEPSVMGTENALMAAALTPGTTVIRNAASEPHVQDLARMLDAHGRGDRGHRLQRDARPRASRKLGGCEHTRLARPHRDRARSWRSPA